MDEDELINAKVIIDSRNNEVKIVLGKFVDEQTMYAAAKVICDHLNIEFRPLLATDNITKH